MIKIKWWRRSPHHPSIPTPSFSDSPWVLLSKDRPAGTPLSLCLPDPLNTSKWDCISVPLCGTGTTWDASWLRTLWKAKSDTATITKWSLSTSTCASVTKTRSPTWPNIWPAKRPVCEPWGPKTKISALWKTQIKRPLFNKKGKRRINSLIFHFNQKINLIYIN